VVLSKRERNIGIFSAIAIAILILNFAIINPLMSDKDDIDKQIVQANATLNEKQTILTRSKKDGPRWTEISRSGLLKDSSGAESQVLNAVSAWARDAQLDPRPSLKTDRTEKYGKYFYKLTIRTTAVGNMSQISRFLYRFETSNIPVRINDLTLASRKDGQDDLSLSMTISTIYLAPENETNNANKPVAMATEVRP
jgi:hypothetical protein